MRGHLQHRGGDAWRIKVYLGRSPDGRRRYLSGPCAAAAGMPSGSWPAGRRGR
jgi:hypothetical protein